MGIFDFLTRRTAPMSTDKKTAEKHEKITLKSLSKRIDELEAELRKHRAIPATKAPTENE